MPDLKITSLDNTGYDGNPLPNRFFRQQGAHTLAVLFPGLRYSCDMPLLYYSFKLLLGRGVEVLQVRADYTRGGYASLPAAERAAWLAADAQAAVYAARQQADYTRFVLVGKSIGTVALASLVPLEPQAVTIWLTPLLRNSVVVDAALSLQGAALFVAGTADDLYHAPNLDVICQATHAETLLIEGGDHSLEIDGDFHASLRALVQVMETLAGFLTRQGV